MTIIIDTVTKISEWYDSSKMSIRSRTISQPPPPISTNFKMTLNGQFCESLENIYFSSIEKSKLAKYADHTFGCPPPHGCQLG